MPILRTIAFTVLVAVYAGGVLVAQGPPSDPWAGYANGLATPVGSASPGSNIATAANVPSQQRGSTVQAARYTMNSRQFEIPVAIDRTGNRPAEIRLYVSNDNGRSWQVSARSQPTQQPFGFSAPADGVYWFATRTFDASGRSFPPGNRFEPQLIVLVDTESPSLNFQASADYDGKVGLSYSIRDAALANNSLSVSYMTDSDQTQWVPVDGQILAASREVSGAIRNEIRFQPNDNWRYLNVRVQVSDQAGNTTSDIQQIQRPRLAGTPAQLAATGRLHGQPPLASASVVNPAGQLPTHPPDTNATGDHGYSMQFAPTGAAANPNSSAARTPKVAQPQQGDINRAQVRVNPQATTMPGYRPATPPQAALRGWANEYAEQNWSGQSSNIAPQAGSAPQSNMQPAGTPARGASSSLPNSTRSDLGSADTPSTEQSPRTNPSMGLSGPANGQAQSASPSPSAPVSPSSVMRPRTIETLPVPSGTPDAQYTTAADSTQVDATDPTLNLLDSESVAQHMRSEKPNVPPAVQIAETEVRHTKLNRFELSYEVDSLGARGVKAVELWGTRDGGQTWSLWGQDEDNESPFDIETRGSGLYGFSIVVVGHNGLTSPPPRDGDPAEIWIRVDQDAPRARIVAARYGEGAEAGSLIIEYQCEDGHLLDRAITLAFSPSADGPWTTIASGLENTGRYAWPADPRLPRQIYLRIEAVDHAGNLGIDSTARPISVHGLAPRARIRGFQPISQP